MAFGTFKVLAGDFQSGNASQYVDGKLIMKTEGKFFREKIPVTEIATLERATEEAIINTGGAIGWGLAGSLMFGPAGLVAGLMLGGKGQEITFICTFKDGRKFLATTSSKLFHILEKVALSISFDSNFTVKQEKSRKKKWGVVKVLSILLAAIVGFTILMARSHG